MNKQAGQALLVVLLVMAVLGTVVLSAVSRSVTDITVTTKEDEAIRAFSAAEAGIEKGLLSGIGGTIASTTGELSSGGSFNAQVQEIGSSSPRFKVPTPLVSGESATVWFVDHDSQGNLNCSTGNCSIADRMYVCWGNSGDGNAAPALEVSVYYQDGIDPSPDFSQVKIKRTAHDSFGTRSVQNNRFLDGAESSDHCTLGLGYSYQIGLSNPRGSGTRFAGPLFARLKLLYNTEPRYVGVYTRKIGEDVNLPKQGIIVTSTGTSGDATRKVVVNKLYSDVPPIFDFGVFSGSEGLEK